MSIVNQVADGVVAAIDGATLSLEATPERHYQPRFELAEMDTLHVSVVPKGVTINALGRDRLQYDVQVDVAVQQRFAEGSNPELDPLMDYVEEIADLFRLKRLPGELPASWIRTENDPVFAPEHMQELRQFTSVLTLTYRVVR